MCVLQNDKLTKWDERNLDLKNKGAGIVRNFCFKIVLWPLLKVLL